MPKTVNLIVACGENRVIGRGRRLPWRIPEDWEHLHRQTAGQIAILGRVSFKAWPTVTTDHRRAIVVTRDATLAGAAVQTAPTLAAALEIAEALPGEIYVCGGERLFAEAMALPQAQRLYLTLVHAQPEGDKYFPDWHAAFPRVLAQRESHDAHHRYTFFELGRA